MLRVREQEDRPREKELWYVGQVRYLHRVYHNIELLSTPYMGLKRERIFVQNDRLESMKMHCTWLRNMDGRINRYPIFVEFAQFVYCCSPMFFGPANEHQTS